MKPAAKCFNGEDGQAVILIIVAMSILLIGALGLAIDGGQMYAQRQMAQAAADSAAQAGIMSIFRGTNATSAHPFGTGAAPIASSVCTTGDNRTPCVYARNNGFGGTAADTVTLSYPATVSGITLTSGSVPAFAVTVKRTLKTSLIRFVGAGATTSITAKATAALVGTVSPDSIIVLDSPPYNTQSAFLASNGAVVNIGLGAIQVNSNNSKALSISGGAKVSAAAIDVVRGSDINNGGSSTPAPVTGKPSVPDPFASLPSPAVGACNHTNYSPGYGNFTLNPGVYCGGITLNNGATATFNPGMYIINGGGVTLGGANPITGSGLTFYLTGTNSTYRSVAINNGQSVTFSAAASGPYQGVLFYQDRSITSGNDATFAGGASMNLTGSLYFPTTNISFSNGSGGAGYTALVSKGVSFQGGANLQYDSTGSKTGLFSKAVALVQ